MQVEFAGRVEAAELEFDDSGAVSERAGVLQVLAGSSGIIRKEEPGEEGIAAAEVVIPVVPDRDLPASLHLAACSRSVTAQELKLSLLYAAQAVERLAFQFGGTLKVRCGRGDVSKGEVRGRSTDEGVSLVLCLCGERKRAVGVLEGLSEVTRAELKQSKAPGVGRLVHPVGGIGVQPPTVRKGSPRPREVAEVRGE